MAAFDKVYSGLPGFDEAVQHIRMGDNVVWQLSSLDEYRFLVKPFVEMSLREGRNLTYIRFAGHAPVVDESLPGLKVEYLDADVGFERFTVNVHNIIRREGCGAFYVFDSLSELQNVWASDLMMGNFFRVTCPYLFELDTVAYFGVIRNRHQFETIAQIRETTQLLLDIYSADGEMFVHPLKVWNRYSQTMFLPHRISPDGTSMHPLTDAVAACKFYTVFGEESAKAYDCSLDNYDRIFIQAANAPESASLRQLCSMVISKEQRILDLACRIFTVPDLLRIKERLIGSGSVGGKSSGMLIARKIAEKNVPSLRFRMEPHDSYYIGSDVFYTYLVRNGWWKLRLRQRTGEGYFTAAAELGAKIMEGTFPEGIREQFRRMLDYFGQSPIIVRSSSLLEDSFGNAFAGKYESIFCVNAGSPEERFEAFERAVKGVYASSMNESALIYRKQRHLDKSDEQMAILVQRVSGSLYDDIFLPTAAGVGYSYNSYVWNREIDPSAGMLRIVMGLGTRAVDRTEQDYPRIAALDRPDCLPIHGSRAEFAQRYIDVLDLKTNRLCSKPIDSVLPKLPPRLADFMLEHDCEAEHLYENLGTPRNVYYTSCESVLHNRTFLSCMSEMMQSLQKEYNYPVDIEFTANFNADGEFVINLLQCRPLFVSGGQRELKVVIPETAPENVLFSQEGNSMGGNTSKKIDYVVIVDPVAYSAVPFADKYETARAVGRINASFRSMDGKLSVLLMGPGRWGTSSPELGVPVTFAEISEVDVICEVSCAGMHLMPELSFGSHFFQDLVENGMFYAAIFGTNPGVLYQPEVLVRACQDVSASFPVDEKGLIRVYRCDNLHLYSDIETRRTLCCLL